jgi:hypothetical protein
MLIIGETRWGSKWKLYYLHKFSVNLKKFILKLNYFCRGKGSDRVLKGSEQDTGLQLSILPQFLQCPGIIGMTTMTALKFIYLFIY